MLTEEEKAFLSDDTKLSHYCSDSFWNNVYRERLNEKTAISGCDSPTSGIERNQRATQK